MHPIQSVDSIATTTKRLVSGAQSSVGTTVARRMIRPPIVGVPALALVAGRPLGADDLPHLPRPQPRDDRRAHDEREQQRRHGRARGAKADVVEEIEDDVRLAERREPVIEHRASAGWSGAPGGGSRAGRERRKYTFEGHAAGCLEHHDLVAPEALGQERRRAPPDRPP